MDINFNAQKNSKYHHHPSSGMGFTTTKDSSINQIKFPTHITQINDDTNNYSDRDLSDSLSTKNNLNIM